MKHLICATLFVSLLVAAPASAGSVELSGEQPATLFMSTTAEGCQNSPGPEITLVGGITLGGINARIMATNNRKLPAQHSGSEDVFVDVVLGTAGDTISFAKGGPEGPGGNPHIFVWFNDCNGGYLTNKPTYLGRCVQGLADTSLVFDLLTTAELEATSGSCSNSPGPEVTLDGELTLGGVCATLIFSNNLKLKKTHQEAVEVEITLLDFGEQIHFDKQGSLPEGVTGNPWLWLQLLNGAGEEMTGPVLLGKCVQL